MARSADTARLKSRVVESRIQRANLKISIESRKTPTVTGQRIFARRAKARRTTKADQLSRAALLGALLGSLTAETASAETFRLTSLLNGRAAYARGTNSWLANDFGRMDTGGQGIEEHRSIATAVADVGVDWTPNEHIGVHIHAAGRIEPSDYQGSRGGLVEAFGDLRGGTTANELQLRAGLFFLPTSRENRDELWASPYTITLSALNTWIAHEFRPVGADIQWRHNAAAWSATIAATAFQGNDTMGALLGWNGWGIGNRLTVWNEVLPLAPLFSFRDPAMFVDQRRDGSKPFGSDLDGRIGYAARARLRLPERGLIQVTRVDNRGDRQLYRGEYAWATEFNVIGAEIGREESMIVLGEWARGKTGMGATSGAHVDVDFSTFYVLTSARRGKHRWSLRYDRFSQDDRDHSIAENNDETGDAWTAAWLYDFNPSFRGAIEFSRIAGDRLAAEQSGHHRDVSGNALTFELRYALRR